ncbi:hypothetical protein HK101_010375 [Irineochytrium annulatum]|nr:hypothetical protein HK101_010375 [Irineochytrium annulatum]
MDKSARSRRQCICTCGHRSPQPQRRQLSTFATLASNQHLNPSEPLDFVDPSSRGLPNHISLTSSNTTAASTAKSSSTRTSSASKAAPKPSHGFYNNRVLERYAERETKRVTLRQLTVFGRHLTEEKLIKSANYVREELPVRLAHRIRGLHEPHLFTSASPLSPFMSSDFQHLPFIVGTNPHIEQLYNLYWDAFERFRSFGEIKTLEENREFCELVEEMLERHLVAIPQLAMGIAESSEHLTPAVADRFMNEMLRSRIGRRVLAEQHITLSAVFDGREAHDDGWIGIVNTKCRASDVIHLCSTLAGNLFRESNPNTLLQPPEVLIDGHKDAHFTYIPDHIEYIVFELIRNSMRATLNAHGDRCAAGGAPLPPIRVTVGRCDTAITFRVSDQGGGIKKEALANMWSYVDASKRTLMNFERLPKLAAKVTETVPDALSLGLGLPMSRVYANYWGGAMALHSMHGYGTDAYVKIAVGNQMENLTYESEQDFPQI